MLTTVLTALVRGGLVLQESGGLDLDTSGPTRQQVALAVLVLFGLLGLFALVSLRNRYKGLTDEQERHKSALTQSKHDADPVTIQLSVADLHENATATRERLLTALRGEGASSEETTARHAYTALWNDIEARLGMGPIPSRVRQLGTMTVWSLVFGFTAFSTGVITGALRNGPSAGLGAVGGGLGAVIGAIPFLQEIIALAGALLLVLGLTLFQSWVLTTAILAVLTLVVFVDARRGEDADTGLLGTAGTVAGYALVPVVAVYGLLTLLSLPRIVHAWVQAPTLTKGLALFTVMALVMLLVAAAAAVFPHAAGQIRAAGRREYVRLAALRRGFPVMTVVFVYLLTSRFLPITGAIVVSVLVGLVVRQGVLVAVRLTEGAQVKGTGRDVKRSVVVQVYHLEDDDGQTHPVTEVDTATLAWPDVEALADMTLTAAQERSEEDRVPSMIATEFAHDLLERGETDHTETIARVRQDVRDALATRDSPVRVETVRDDLAEKYPREVWEPALETWERGDELQRHGEFYEVRR